MIIRSLVLLTLAALAVWGLARGAGKSTVAWRRVAIVIATLTATYVWLAASLLTQGCDDTCSDYGPWWEHRDAWQWNAQFWLATAALGLAAGPAIFRLRRVAVAGIVLALCLIVVWIQLMSPVGHAPV